MKSASPKTAEARKVYNGIVGVQHITKRNRISKSKSEFSDTVADRDLYSGLIRLHVLHHAVEGPIFGLGMIEELARHGYHISPGSLYPLLQGLGEEGLSPIEGEARREIAPASVPGDAARSQGSGCIEKQSARAVS